VDAIEKGERKQCGKWQVLLSHLTGMGADVLGTGKVGKEVLQDLVKRNKDEYAALMKEEKEELVQKLEQAKATKTKGFHLLVKSHINDVTSTLHVLENEVFTTSHSNLFTDKY